MNNLMPGVTLNDPHFQEQPAATIDQIRLAIVVRHAKNDADIWETAQQLAEILAEYEVGVWDIQIGLPTRELE